MESSSIVSSEELQRLSYADLQGFYMEVSMRLDAAIKMRWAGQEIGNNIGYLRLLKEQVRAESTRRAYESTDAFRYAVESFKSFSLKHLSIGTS